MPEEDGFVVGGGGEGVGRAAGGPGEGVDAGEVAVEGLEMGESWVWLGCGGWVGEVGGDEVDVDGGVGGGRG